jgi:hypothetical protein
MFTLLVVLELITLAMLILCLLELICYLIGAKKGIVLITNFTVLYAVLHITLGTIDIFTIVERPITVYIGMVISAMSGAGMHYYIN